MSITDSCHNLARGHKVDSFTLDLAVASNHPSLFNTPPIIALSALRGLA